MKWEIDRFNPSDGSKVCNVKTDHQAEIKCAEISTYLLLQCGSYQITSEQWKTIVDRITEALSKPL